MEVLKDKEGNDITMAIPPGGYRSYKYYRYLTMREWISDFLGTELPAPGDTFSSFFSTGEYLGANVTPTSQTIEVETEILGEPAEPEPEGTSIASLVILSVIGVAVGATVAYLIARKR